MLVPLLLYLVAAGVMLTGMRWLMDQGQVGMRTLMLSVVIALAGLPVVVAAGLILRIRGMEAGR